MTKASILKQIRLYCLECSCGSVAEVDRCTMANCPLFAFRFGKDPEPRKLSEKELEMRKQSLARAMEKKKSNCQ